MCRAGHHDQRGSAGCADQLSGFPGRPPTSVGVFCFGRGDYCYAPHGVVFILSYLLSLISYLLSLISYLLSLISYLLSLVPLLIGLGALVPFFFLQDEFTGICWRQGFAVFAVGWWRDCHLKDWGIVVS
ncbi:hypothetical protein GBN16_05975 [Plesiomonas shigelloides]|nr:hypothetical protein GBN16_05975 [Plesiomonas shigelloides]